MMLQTALVSYRTYWPRLFRQFKRVNLILEKRQTDSGQTTQSKVKVKIINISFIWYFCGVSSSMSLGRLINKITGLLTLEPTDP